MIMHSFSSSASYFSPLLEETVDSCRNIEDQLVLFDGKGKILAVRTSQPALRDTEDFFSLLALEEHTFFERHCVGFEHDRLLLMTAYGAALVFCHLFPTCGYFVAVILGGAAGDVRRLLGEGMMWGALASEASLSAVDCDWNGGDATLSQTVWEAVDAFCFDRERRGVPCDLGQTLVDRVCAVARFVGCHVVVRADRILNLSDAFVFHLPAFLSVLLALLMRARRESPTRRADVVILERDGRLFIEISAEWSTEESSTLSLARATCERKEFPFEVRRAGGVETVTFSPTVCDVSYLGLKNPFVFE